MMKKDIGAGTGKHRKKQIEHCELCDTEMRGIFAKNARRICKACEKVTGRDKNNNLCTTN
jgi:hypothetical protein